MNRPPQDSSLAEGERRAVQIRFLENFMELASHSSTATAMILRKKFKSAKSVKLRKVIITRIFAEYIASLELFAAVCLALRNRRSTDMLEWLSTYSADDIRHFYGRVLKDPQSFSFMEFAALPTIDVVRGATREPEIHDAYVYSSHALSRRVRDVATQLGSSGFLPIHIYNKIKHSNLFVDDPEILKRHYDYWQAWGAKHEEEHVYVVPKFRVSKDGGREVIHPPAILSATEEFAHKLVSNTHQLHISIKEIAGLALLMDRLGLLCPEDGDPPS